MQFLYQTRRRKVKKTKTEETNKNNNNSNKNITITDTMENQSAFPQQDEHGKRAPIR